MKKGRETPELTSYEDVLDLYVQPFAKMEEVGDILQWYEVSSDYTERGFADEFLDNWWYCELSQLQNPLEYVGFCYLDLDGDGTDELLIGQRYGDYCSMDGGYVLAVYGMAETEQKPVLVLEGWEKNLYVIGKDGFLYNLGSSGAMSTTFLKYQYRSGNELEAIEEVYSYLDAEALARKWEYVTNPDDIGKIEEEPSKHLDLSICEEEAWEIGNAWMESGQKLEFTSFENYLIQK